MTDTDRQFLFDLRKSLLHLHKTLLDWERAAYERIHGRISSSELLKAIVEDPQFGWLRPISELIVRIDETVDTELPQSGSAEVEALARAGARGDRRRMKRERLTPSDTMRRCRNTPTRCSPIGRSRMC